MVVRQPHEFNFRVPTFLLTVTVTVMLYCFPIKRQTYNNWIQNNSINGRQIKQESWPNMARITSSPFLFLLYCIKWVIKDF